MVRRKLFKNVIKYAVHFFHLKSFPSHREDSRDRIASELQQISKNLDFQEFGFISKKSYSMNASNWLLCVEGVRVQTSD